MVTKVKIKKITLNCKQAVKMIPDFIDRKMPYADLEPFMEHIRDCDNCREELSIQFLVNVGLSSLEEGNTFDLQEELNAAMEDAYRRVRVHQFLQQSLVILGIIAAVAVVVVVLILILRFL